MGRSRKVSLLGLGEVPRRPSMVPPKWERHFWGRESYTQFAMQLPSNCVASSLLYCMLNPGGKAILDFGCYRGNSSKSLLDVGAQRVLGVDRFRKNIYAARALYGGERRLSFLHVEPRAWIPQRRYFEGASMTFVHPTIATREELFFSFRKIQRALKPGGPLGMLGLHPRSLNPRYKFLYYGHTLPEGRRYADGVEFENLLRLPGGTELRFSDRCWTEKTLVSLLESSGFSVESVFGIRWSELTPRLRACFKGARDEVAKTGGIEWLDEWTAPLYQVFFAVKK